MKIEVNIEKKYAFAIIGLLVIIASLITGYAFSQSGTGGTPSNMGHSVDEIDWSKTINSNVAIQGNLNLNGNVSSSGVCIAGSCKTNWSQVGNSASGTLCGLSILGDFGAVDNAIPCQGMYPSAGCPSGYTKVLGGRITWDYDYIMGTGGSYDYRISGAHLIHCVKN